MRALFGVAGLLGLVVIPDLASGQQPEERLRLETEGELRRLNAAEDAGAASRQGVAAPDVSYRDVLANPDDLETNYLFARAQLARGDLKGASATLERILLLAPAEAQVRLLFGLVLLRLDHAQRAADELRRALDAGLPAELTRRAREALDRAERDLATTHGALTLSAGLRYDDNRDQAPEAGRQLFVGTPIDADDGTADFAQVGVLQGRLEHDIVPGRQLQAEAIWYESNQNLVDDLDLRLLGADVGLAETSGAWTVTPRITGDYMALAGETYLRDAGAGVEVAYRISTGLTARLDGQALYEDFMANRAAPDAELRDGWRTRLEAGLEWRYDPRYALDAAVVATRKDADARFESYDGLELRLGHRFLLGGGQFVLAQASYEHRVYDADDPLVAPGVRRSDDVYGLRLTYGIPLQTMFGDVVELPALLGETQLILGYERVEADSNLANYAYDSNRVQTLLSRQFLF